MSFMLKLNKKLMKPVQAKVSENLHSILHMIKNIESETLSTIAERALIFYVKNYDKIYKNKYHENLSPAYIDLINEKMFQS